MGPRRKACCSGCQIIITEIRTQLAYPFVLWETQNIVSQGACRKVEWKDPPWVWGETVPSPPAALMLPFALPTGSRGYQGLRPQGAFHPWTKWLRARQRPWLSLSLSCRRQRRPVQGQGP